MAVHLPSSRHGLPGGIRVGIHLREVLLDGQQARGHHQGLVTVVSTAEIARLKLPGQGQLRHLFPVAENAKLGLARQNLLPAQQGSFPADASQSVIVERHLAEVVTNFKRESLSHEVDGAARSYR